MDGGQDSFLDSIQTAVRDNKSCEYTLRLCSCVRGARRPPFPRPCNNRRVGCFMLRKQRVNRLEQHFRETDKRCRGYCVTTCQLWLTFVSSLDHYNVLITPREITTNIKHVLPAQPLQILRLQSCSSWSVITVEIIAKNFGITIITVAQIHLTRHFSHALHTRLMMYNHTTLAQVSTCPRHSISMPSMLSG